MIFETQVRGVKCYCEVTEYTPAEPMLITGSGMGDAEPPEDEVFEFQLLDLNTRRRIKALDEQVTPTIHNRLLTEYKEQLLDF